MFGFAGFWLTFNLGLDTRLYGLILIVVSFFIFDLLLLLTVCVFA